MRGPSLALPALRRATLTGSSGAIVLAVASMALTTSFARGDGTYQTLPLSQNWTNTGLITANDVWSGVPGVIGYRGDDLVMFSGADPRTITAADDPGVIDVNANETDPNTFGAGGLTEFQIANPVVAFQGSSTADAPYMKLHVNTLGMTSVTLSYRLRDIDGSFDNAPQQVNAQYRIGSSGSWTNIPGTYVADATQGPSLSGLETPVSVVLPAAAVNQPQVQIRIMTTNALSVDEWVGVDDISVTGVSNQVSDIGVGDVCVTLDDTPEACTDTLFTQQPWHILFTVGNEGEKAIDNWSFDIRASNGDTAIALKTQVAGARLAVGADTTINCPSPREFSSDDKGPWSVTVTVTVKEPTNPDANPANNQASAAFEVVNKPPPPVSDIGVRDVCMALDDGLKACTDTLFTQQPWHILFTVANKGEKALDLWSFDITLVDPQTGDSTALKAQEPGAPLQVGESRRINWPSPRNFDVSEKGQWQVVVRVALRDSANPEPTPLQANNHASTAFEVQNKPPPISDIGVHDVCVSRDDPLKECTGFLFTEQPWHIQFNVFNKGEKPLDSWNFGITLVNLQTGDSTAIKTGQPGPEPPVQMGESRRINWPSPRDFTVDDKGQWQVRVNVAVLNAANPEPDSLQTNNRAFASFQVLNQPPPSDIGVRDLCVTPNDPLEACTDTVFTRQPWHILFNVVNKGEKPVTSWSFDIDLIHPSTGDTIPLKSQVAGGPLTLSALYGATTSGPDGPSNFYQIDPSTGTATFIGPIGFDRVGALDAHPVTGVLYGTGVRPSTVTSGSIGPEGTPGPVPVLITIDPATGAGTEVGPTGMSAQITDLSFRPSDNTLFAFDAANSPQHKLFRVDITTGLATLVGSTGFSLTTGNGMEFSKSGVLYHGDDNSFNTLDPSTGAGTALHSPPNYPGGTNRPSAFDFDPVTGVLYAEYKNLGSGSGDFLGTYDPVSGSGTIIGTTEPGLDAIAFASSASVRIDWPSPHEFTSSEKGPWRVEVSVAFKDPTNPEPHARQGNNRATDDFVVVNHPLTGSDEPLLTELRLMNSPNPFEGSTHILFDLPRANHAELEVYDLGGRLVKRLLSRSLPAGSHSAIWNGADESGRSAPAGVYLYRLRVGGLKLTRRMVLMK